MRLLWLWPWREHCGFYSFEQCMAALSGNGGSPSLLLSIGTPQTLNLNGLAGNSDIRANRVAAGISSARAKLVSPAHAGAVKVAIIVDVRTNLCGERLC